MSTLAENKKNNIKLFVVYKMFAWDLLFYYAIAFLFLTQIKGFQAHQVLFADGFYPIFRLISQIPATICVEKLGKRKSLVIANFCVSVFLGLLIILPNIPMLILANFICAIGFTIKAIAEPNLLYDSIDDNDNKSKVFSTIEGKATSFYYYIDALSAIIAGSLFMVNGYLPLFISLSITILTIILAFLFKDIPLDPDSESLPKWHFKLNPLESFEKYTKDFIASFKLIIQSNRLKALLLFDAMFTSLIAVMVSLNVALLTYINLSSKNIGIIFAILSVVAGFSARRAYSIHLKYRNKSLSFLALSYTLAILFSGFVVYIGLYSSITLFFILIFLMVQSLVKAPFFTLMKQYLSNFSNSSIRIKIFSANSSVVCISRSILTFICSYIIRIFSIDVAIILIGSVSTLIIILILNYMKTRVGLKPENYTDSDIRFYNAK